jgi:hypothetical protein
VGDYVINLLGCQGTNPELATDYSQWQLYRECAENYPDEDELKVILESFREMK